MICRFRFVCVPSWEDFVKLYDSMNFRNLIENSAGLKYPYKAKIENLHPFLGFIFWCKISVHFFKKIFGVKYSYIFSFFAVQYP